MFSGINFMDDKTLLQIEIIDLDIRQITCAEIYCYHIVLPLPIQDDNEYCGFDPGTRNFGIAVIKKDKGTVYKVNIKTSRDPIERIRNTQQILKRTKPVSKNSIVTIEGAAFRGGFAQQELAEMRATVAIYSSMFAQKVFIAAPMSVRKAVFGNGKTKAHEVWTGLPNDTLAALSCAYYGYRKE
jgi:Holliday junction resolvasome RuvABC endonuclease subunit